MKRFRMLMIFAALLAVLSSCTDDLGKAVSESSIRSGGTRLGSSLSIVPLEDPTETKSTFTGSDAAVSEWTLLQFDAADGRLVAKYYQASGADITNIEVVAGHAYHWFAVANCGDMRGEFTLGTSTVSSMSGWVVTGLDMADRQAKGTLPMAWTSVQDNPAGVGFTGEQLRGGAVLRVSLKRLVAKYDIAIVRSNLTKYTFNVEGARVVGPTAARPFAMNQAAAVVEGADVATTSGTDSDRAKLNSGSAMTFYALENMYGEKAVADAWQKKPKSLGANDRPTYVEIMGKAAGGGLTDIAVTYRFFLGTNATSNFDVIRNTANSVTLTLSDAAIDAALQESGSSTPPSDPIWKIEAGGYTDGRVLQFADGVAAGGSGLQVVSGTYTAEGVQRTPSDLNYRFKLDAALYAAGMRVFYDAAGASELPSGYGSGWVTLSGSPETLYFYIPVGSAYCTGQAHVITADGRKYDDLDVRAGRQLDYLSITPSKVYCPTVAAVTGENRDYKLYAHFTDGSVDDITVDPSVVWNLPAGNYVSSVNGFGVKFGTFQAGQIVVLSGNRVSVFKNNGEYKRINMIRIQASQYEMAHTYSTWSHVMANNPVTLFSADYTFGGVTKSAVVQATVDDTRQPQVLAIAPATQDAYVGGRPVALTATVTYDDGTTADVTATAAWADDAAGLLANNGGGSYTTGSTSGTTTVTASYTANGVTVTGNTATVNVLDRAAVAVQLQVRPDGAADWTTDNQVVSVGTYQSWRLRVDYADGGEPDYLDAGFTVSSTVPSVLSVGSGGVTTFAEAVGTSSVSTTFAGLASNSIAVEVRDHDYTYELIVSTAGVSSSTTLEFVRSCAVDVTLEWDESIGFNAYLVRYDNGVLDPSFGTGVLAGKPFRDVSAAAAWSITSNLTNVGTWTASTRQYVASNTSGRREDGTVTATYSDGGINASDDIGLRVRPYVAPSLEGSPLSLEWEWHQAGSGDAKTVFVTAVNCSWSVKSVSSGFGYSVSSSSVSVWPLSQNTSSSNLTGTLVLEGTDGVADVVVDLTQYNWSEGPGGIRRRIVDVYIARSADFTTPITSDVIDAGGSETYNLVCHSQYSVGSGAWNDEYDVVAGSSLSWTTSTASHHTLSLSGAYNKENARVTNTNATGSDQTVTLAADPAGNYNGDRIWIPAEFAYVLTSGGYGASVDITLRAGTPPTIYRIVTGVSPASVAWDGTASASATLQSSDNGGGSWSTVRSVTSSVSFSADDACVSVSGSTLTANNTSSSAKSVEICAGGYSGSEAIVEYVPAQLTVGGADVYEYEYVSLELSPGDATLSYGTSVTETVVANYRWRVNGGGWTVATEPLSSGFDWSWTGDTGAATRSGGMVTNANTSSSAASVTVTATMSSAKTVTVGGGSFTIPSGTSASADIALEPGRTLEYITVGDARATFWAPVNSVAYGDNISMTCTAHYSDGTTEDVTSAASWGTATNVGHTGNVYTCSSNDVSASGESRNITVSYGGKSTDFTLTLYPKYVVRMTVNFGSTFGLSDNAKPRGEITYNDGSTASLQAGQLDSYEVYESSASAPVRTYEPGDDVDMKDLGTGAFNIYIYYTSKRYGSDNTVDAGKGFLIQAN